MRWERECEGVRVFYEKIESKIPETWKRNLGKKWSNKNSSCKQLMSFMWFSSLFRGYTFCGFPQHSKGCFILFSRFQRINIPFLYFFSLPHFKPTPSVPISLSLPVFLSVSHTHRAQLLISVSLRSSSLIFSRFLVKLEK